MGRCWEDVGNEDLQGRKIAVAGRSSWSILCFGDGPRNASIRILCLKRQDRWSLVSDRLLWSNSSFSIRFVGFTDVVVVEDVVLKTLVVLMYA